jgi:hypothetical protein
MSEGLNLYWEELCDFIKNRNSIDIGGIMYIIEHLIILILSSHVTHLNNKYFMPKYYHF